MHMHSKTTMKKRFLMRLVLLTCLLVMGMAGSAMAAGWSQSSNKVTYTQSDGTLATGLTKIGSKTYYFNKKGVLQTGWIKISKKIHYFATSGAFGKLGAMATGQVTIDSKKFYFDTSSGVLFTGMKTIGKYTYYFKKTSKMGTSGAAVVKKFAVYKKNTYYFNKKGRMVKNKWVSGKYLGSDGKMLVSTVTPDSYLVDDTGSKVKKVSTGLIVINNKTYYWSKSKKAFLKNTSKTIKGVTYTFDENGVGTVTSTTGTTTASTESTTTSSDKPNILIVAGHGQGDSGAVSSLGKEYKKTREFAKLIYNKLKASGKVNVTLYKNGSTSYDMYQQNVKTLGSSGANLSTKITGKGKIKKKVAAAMKKNSNLPVLTNYDYVLEVHFNATGTASKDISGDGSYKGFGFYINSYKSKTGLEKNIVRAIKKLGFSIWGGSSKGTGVSVSSTLFNARICQELGVSYALVETAFIDDKDDMKFYNKKKSAMASAIANAIVAYYTK